MEKYLKFLTLLILLKKSENYVKMLNNQKNFIFSYELWIVVEI